ncbi:MAG: hypothetical protein ABIW16_03050 [Sphingomicrobium sp.]
MVHVPEEQDADRPRLALEHDGGLPDARQTGAMLDRVALAYSGYTRLGYHSKDHASDLVLEQVRLGSLYVVLKDALETAGAVLTLYDHRELLGGFVAQLNDAMASMRRLGSPLPMYRNAVEALSAPVRSGRATTVKLTVIGDNNRILIIDKVAAEDIRKFLGKQPRSERGRNQHTREVRRPSG